MFLLTSGCLGSVTQRVVLRRASAALCSPGDCKQAQGLRYTPFITAMEFFASKRVGEIWRLASVMRTRGCIFWRSHDLGRVSYRGAAGFTVGLWLAQRGAVENEIYLMGRRMHEFTRVS